jgi:hypothetical protein
MGAKSYKDGDGALTGDYSRSGGHLDARALYFGLMKMVREMRRDETA